ncbi:hypothetical protein BXY82_3042 [Gelidibacter sediminis]|uniref:Uncharacterized protein n=2 Tax=Flavobacteriaceae TaxID=49546 RepID=A0A1H3WGX5_BIZPA|nr:hypothetical protein BXY82_3042 [Gelidibacter sediminis]SDZ86061.1 hypothetical protein SAMN04487990_10376 [Bizionia paragorgiae]
MKEMFTEVIKSIKNILLKTLLEIKILVTGLWKH